MNKIYQKAKDLHVVATIVYASENQPYTSAKHDTKFKVSELKEAFVKGALIGDGDVYYKPVAINLATGVLTYINGEGQPVTLTPDPDEVTE